MVYATLNLAYVKGDSHLPGLSVSSIKDRSGWNMGKKVL